MGLTQIKLPKFPELHFEEKRHIYKIDKHVVTSVSAVMRPLSDSYYGSIDTGLLSAAASRGLSVHQAIENFHEYGITDIPIEFTGYFAAYTAWLEDVKPEIIETESQIYHRFMRYAGTIDAIAQIDGKLVCIDYKTSSAIVEMLARVQLEAYAKAYESHGIKFDGKQIVHLQKDGNYTVKEFSANDSEAWQVFCALATVKDYINKYGR